MALVMVELQLLTTEFLMIKVLEALLSLLLVSHLCNLQQPVNSKLLLEQHTSSKSKQEMLSDTVRQHHQSRY